jgi:hypothetical protein
MQGAGPANATGGPGDHYHRFVEFSCHRSSPFFMASIKAGCSYRYFFRALPENLLGGGNIFCFNLAASWISIKAVLLTSFAGKSTSVSLLT